MATVYFDPAVGGDGSTVTDDTNPTTGLGNGGHRTRFVPALAQSVAVAAHVVDGVVESTAQAVIAATQAGISTTQAGIATTKAGEASVSQTSASASATTATAQAVIATTQAGISTAQAVIATTKASESSASAVAAAVSQTSSSTSASSASLSASRAAESEINAETYALAGRASLDYRGAWSSFTSLASGVAGETYSHDDEIWMLLVNVADIRTVEPSVDLPATWWAVREQAEFVPSVKPTLDLDFANNSYTIYDSFENSFVKKPLADILTFTRGTVANGADAFGKLSEAAIDKPRLVFNGETGEAEGLLAEGSATNLITWSEDFSNAVWVARAGNSITSTNSSMAPDGNLTADTLTIVAAGVGFDTTFRHTTMSVTSGTSYTGSIYVKAPIGVTVTLRLNAETSETASMVGDGTWHKLTVTIIPTATSLNFMIGADVVGDLYIWGAQLTATSYATSYIKTEASQVTRLTDSPKASGLSYMIAKSAAILVEFAPYYDVSHSIFRLARSDGQFTTGAFGIQKRTDSGGLQFVIRTSSNAYTFNVSASLNIGQLNKLCMSYNVDTAITSVAINGELFNLTGVTQAMYTEIGATINTLDLLTALSGTGFSHSVKAYKRIRSFPTLSPTDCIKLTKL